MASFPTILGCCNCNDDTKCYISTHGKPYATQDGRRGLVRKSEVHSLVPVVLSCLQVFLTLLGDDKDRLS